MSARSFFDSNLLAYTDDNDAPDKQEIAFRLLEEKRLANQGVISTQVLQEYFVASTRKLKVPSNIARRKVELFARFHVVQIGPEDILAAIDLRTLHQFSFWDALIIRAANRANCSVLYSEDLQHGFRINGLEIVNPFV